MMWWDDSYMFGGWWVMAAMGIFWLVILATTIAVLMYAISQWRKNSADHARGGVSAPTSATASSARAILDARYARGDITTEEYLERATHLTS